MSTTDTKVVALRNYSDDELLKYVDRTNPETDELCRRFQYIESGEMADLRSSIRELEIELDSVETELSEAEGEYRELCFKLKEKYPEIAKELGV